MPPSPEIKQKLWSFTYVSISYKLNPHQESFKLCISEILFATSCKKVDFSEKKHYTLSTLFLTMLFHVPFGKL